MGTKNVKKAMREKRYTKLVHEGEYIAEVDVQLIYTDDGWSPYLSVEDASKLDNVREALKHGDLKAAVSMARVFTLKPIAI
jgi:hypothetical protein